MIETPRLILREWIESDLEPFTQLCADERVREHFPSTLDREQSAEWATRIGDHFRQHGFGFWAVECRAGAPFIGYLGLNTVSFEAHFTPAVEIGWGFARQAWGQGYATEAARAALDFGFETLALAEIVSFTVPANVRSWALMERIGMRRDRAGDFDHPSLAKGHPLGGHVLYRVEARGWRALPGSRAR